MECLHTYLVSPA